MGNNKEKYHLTPSIDGKLSDIYKAELKHVLEAKNITNIGIIGIYGAGKSSIWQAYSEENKIDNILVSLGAYEKFRLFVKLWGKTESCPFYPKVYYRA